MTKPGIFLGALVSGLLTLPLLAVLYIGQQIAGFPFVPFGLFINVRDYTPGGVITFVIDQMISVITTLNLGRVDTVAKSIEIALGIIMMLVITIIAGALFFAYLRRRDHRQEWLPGAVFGLIVGVPLTVISLIGNQIFNADPLPSAIWLLGLFLIWGYANNWAYNRLTYALTNAAPDLPAQDVRVQQVDRRQFLIQLGGATAAITVVGALVGSMSGNEEGVRSVAIASDGAATEAAPSASLASADSKLQPAPGTRSEITPVADFYRIDISLVPPSLDLATWTLPWFVKDADGNETKFAELTMDDIRGKFAPVEQYITQGCISNRIAGDLISTVKWTGASMQDVLKEVKLPEGTTHLLISGADGFYETVALDLINSDSSIVLAYDFDDAPLPERNGFPLRIHVPNLYGMKQPKWITKIEALTHDVDGYWVVRGWDKIAEVRAVSVIDTVATQNVITEGDRQFIPVGGIAWAGSRGISKVEVSIDGGDWTEAQLREPLSEKTWVIWRYDWPFAEGRHTFAVRCYDGSGAMQITEVHAEHPSGATGVHQVNATVA